MFHKKTWGWVIESGLAESIIAESGRQALGNSNLVQDGLWV